MLFSGTAAEAVHDSPQNQSSTGAQRRLTRIQSVALAVSTGLLGFAINQVPVDMGAGLHLLLGGIPAFMLIRLIAPGLIAIAVAIAAAETYFLWGHPWAALIWVLEGSAVSIMVARTKLPLVAADSLFWVILGGPLVWIAYTYFLNTDSVSASLTLLKQITNGILVVVVGEAGGFLLLRFDVFRSKPPIRIPFDVVILNLMVIFTIVSGITFVAWEGMRREKLADTLIDRELATLESWVKHSAILASRFETSLYLVAAKSNPLDLANYWNTLNSASFRSIAESLTLTASDGSFLARWSRNPNAPDDPNAPLIEINRLENGSSIKATLSLTELYTALNPAQSTGIKGGVHLISPKGNLVTSAAVTPHDQVTSTTLMNSKQSKVRTRLIDLPFPSGWRAEIAIPVAPLVLESRADQVLSLFILVTLTALAVTTALPIAKMVGRLVAWAGDEAASIATAQPLRPLSPALLVVREVASLFDSLKALDTAVAAERLAVRLNRERLELLVSSAPTIIYSLVIKNGKLGSPSMISRSVKNFLGYSVTDSMVETWWRDHIHPEDRAGAEAAVMPLLKTGSVVQQYRFRDKHGNWRWIRDSASLVYDDTGVPLEAVGMWVDVTDDHAAQDLLLHTTKLVTLGEMATGLAHELNQPLNTIALASANARETLTRPQPNLETLARKLDRIDQQVSRARVIIDHMRIFGRADSGRLQPTTVVSLFDGALSLIGASLRSAGITVIREIAPDVPAIAINTVLFEQTIINLISNARDAIQSQGRSGTIVLRAGMNDGKVFLEVEDDGGGIPDSIIGRVMEPFFTTKEPGKGTGLGLSIAYGIAKEHGAELSVKNVCKGASFRLEFPLAANAREPNMTGAQPYADIAS